MPELPEVQTVANQLAPFLTGRTIHSVEIFDPLLRPDGLQAARGRTIRLVRRVGKQVGLCLAAPEASLRSGPWLCIHLRMTGRLAWSPASDQPAAAPLRARLRLDQGALLFNDVRRFGTIKLCPSLAEALPAGLDPLSRSFTPATLAEWFATSRMPVKPWLLRQDRLVGIGNIYASEALHAARIHPARPVASLRPAEITRLHAAIRDVLRRAIRHGGTTISSFENAVGKSGKFQQYLRVYAHEGKPCDNCGHLIQRLVQQQRSTFFCPRCQRARSG